MTGSDEESQGPIIRDRRRIDPVTGQPRQQAPAKAGTHAAARQGGIRRDSGARPDTRQADTAGPGDAGDATAADGAAGRGSPQDAGPSAAAAVALAERTADLQRLQAEYANYRKRVERDRQATREQALAAVLTGLLSVLDDIGRAREHGEVTGGFKSIAEALEAAVAKLGLSTYGTAGEPFDPAVHEALTLAYAPEVTEPTCVQILLPGYKVGDRILRPARVVVAEPADPAGARVDSGSGEPAGAAEPDAGGKPAGDAALADSPDPGAADSHAAAQAGSDGENGTSAGPDTEAGPDQAAGERTADDVHRDD